MKRPEESHLRRVRRLAELHSKKRARRRFAFYHDLANIYRTYWNLRKGGLIKQAKKYLQGNRHGPKRSLLRLLIDAAFPAHCAKQRSRWARALEQARFDNVLPGTFLSYISRRGGVAERARQAAQDQPKRTLASLDVWGDDFSVLPLG